MKCVALTIVAGLIMAVSGCGGSGIADSAPEQKAPTRNAAWDVGSQDKIGKAVPDAPVSPDNAPEPADVAP